jgi:ketosteroid isomerase-like protein
MENQARLEAELTAREAARRDALVASDLDALAELMTDDLVHVHTTGNVHDKAQLLNHAGRFLEFLEVERGPLTIRRIAPDAAIMTGPMTNTVRRRGTDERVTVRAFVTQVWVRVADAWKIASFHAVRVPQDN